MKLTDRISWLMGRVPKSLFPHLNECLPAPLTEQEKRLASILEIVGVERHVPRTVRRYQYPGCKPHDRQALARAFVAKALYRYRTTSDLHRALQYGTRTNAEKTWPSMGLISPMRDGCWIPPIASMCR